MKRPANALALAVLALLSEKPMHPYEISSTLRDRHKEDSIKINYGSLYAVVESLEKRGLIEARERLRTAAGADGLRAHRDRRGRAAAVAGRAAGRADPAVHRLRGGAVAHARLPPERAQELLRQRLDRLRTDEAADRALRAQLCRSWPGGSCGHPG